MKNKELLRGSTSMLVLKILDSEPRYGYDIVRELEKRSMGVFQLQEGTLYPILHSLEADGYVTSRWQEAGVKRRRRYYSITPEGRDALQKRKEEWLAFVNATNRVLNGGEELAPV